MVAEKRGLNPLAPRLWTAVVIGQPKGALRNIAPRNSPLECARLMNADMLAAPHDHREISASYAEKRRPTRAVKMLNPTHCRNRVAPLRGSGGGRRSPRNNRHRPEEGAAPRDIRPRISPSLIPNSA